MPNLVELTMYQISQLFLLPTLALIAGLFLYAFWVLGEFALLALYRRQGKGRPLVTQFRQNSRLTACLLYTSPSPRDRTRSRMPSSA